ncbi:MAG: hypothetical protein KGS61_17805 [Verrucomicrobia bacterium]|nr:hypothetical protein [Verrucomicrobiota bacterium]
MNTTSEPLSMLDRSTIVRAGRWLCHGRNQRKLLIVVASLITLVALAYSVETWTSKRAWEKFKAAAEAKGERLERPAFVPKPVPDDQNFAMTPFFAPLFDFQPGTQHWRDTNAAQRTADFAKAIHTLPNWAGNWALAQPTRLAAWL